MARPASLVAERAVRYLRECPDPVGSVELAREVLATATSDEQAARLVLETAFAGDARLAYGQRGWSVVEAPAHEKRPEERQVEREPERALISLRGARGRGEREFRLSGVSVIRLRGDDVVAACGGAIDDGPAGRRLRRAIIDCLRDAVLVLHDAPGAWSAFDKWLGEPLPAPISLRRLAQHRLGLEATHDFEQLAQRLGLAWRDTDDPLDRGDAVDACLRALRGPRETLDDLRAALAEGAPPIDWSRLAFDRSFLAGIPEVPGTYRFFDAEGTLLYVGKSRNLKRRIGTYFREVARRPARVQRLLERVHRVEYDHEGSELEALLREAEQIGERRPVENVQRQVHAQSGRGARLRSILILEPAAGVAVLRAYLIHEGRLVARIGIGPRGRGLKQIERVLDAYFFFGPDGPTPVAGPDLDVEIVVRWLAANRDRAVAFDPTNLGSAREVVERLRWFLAHGSPFDPDGQPIFTV